jgi:elongation factor 3
MPSVEMQNGATAAEMNELTEMLSQLYTAATSEECDAIARDMAARVQKEGLISLKTNNILANLEAECKNKKSGLAREGALIGICALADVLGRPSEPFLMPLLPLILDLYADKGPVVQDAASRAALAIMANMPSQSAPIVLPILFQSIGGPGKKWQTKVGALQILADLSNASPIQVGIALPEIIPIVKDCLSDTKKEVIFLLFFIITVDREQPFFSFVSYSASLPPCCSSHM